MFVSRSDAIDRCEEGSTPSGTVIKRNDSAHHFVYGVFNSVVEAVVGGQIPAEIIFMLFIIGGSEINTGVT